METSAGMRFSSMSRRQKSNSICEAEGKPTSISLKPIFTSISKYSSFSSTLMGWARAWLPSRRSTLHQMGAWVSVRLGHWRLVKATEGNGRYFVTGADCMGTRRKTEINVMLKEVGQTTGAKRADEPSGRARAATGGKIRPTHDQPLSGAQRSRVFVSRRAW